MLMSVVDNPRKFRNQSSQIHNDPTVMSRSAIVKLYNELAVQTGDKPVGDFRDKASAQRRLAAIQAKVNQE